MRGDRQNYTRSPCRPVTHLFSLYILRGVGVILHKCKPYDFKCLLGKNITQELNITIYIYKEHKIMFRVDMKNYGIYENT